MGNESAVIIPIPEVEPVIARLRRKYDRSAGLGVPAHVTLLYPFCPSPVPVREITTLRDVCGSIAAFPFSFTEVRRFPAIAYLHPDQEETFAQITRLFIKTWPDYKPCGGAHADVVPHLTVADAVDAETLSVVENSLRGQLPIPCVAREVWLLTSNQKGIWSKKAGFPLAGRNTT
jgi:2'-5' RNA ligase